MSCRLIRDSEPRTSQPLFAVNTRRPAVAESTPWLPGTGPEAADPRELDRLRRQVTDLETRLERSVDEGKQQGASEGEAAGYARAALEVKPVLEKLGKAIADTAGLRARIREETEKDLIVLSIAIARRILRRELTVDPDAIGGLVQAALAKVQARDITRIRIYPGHEEAVRRSLTACHASGVDLVAETALQPGDVIIETKRGNLEASIETQLAEIERGFADRIAR